MEKSLVFYILDNMDDYMEYGGEVDLVFWVKAVVIAGFIYYA